MTVTLKRWSQLGLSAALATTALSACGSSDEVEQSVKSEIVAETPPAPIAEPAPVTSAGGEGEGGVLFDQAATDPVIFGSAVAIAEAHIIAARDAHALGENDAAAEMFAHPVSEVLFNLQPVFETLGVTDFSDMFTDASAAVFAGETPDQISARTDAIIATLRTAALKAPASDMSDARIAAGIAADQIERAADMYRIALESDAYEPYLDGYGFYKAGEVAFLAAAEAIAEEDQRAASAIKDALAKLEEAYPSAVRPASLDADVSLLTVAASEVVLAVTN